MTIENPWHSRPLDVHRWSDHPVAIEVSNRLWDEYFPELANDDSRPGPKPKTTFRNQFKVLLLDLWVAWNEDPELSLGVAMGETAWDTNTRYNALHISKKIIPIIKRLEAEGLIDLAKGSYNGPFVPTNRTTRIRASAKLKEIFEASGVEPTMVVTHSSREMVILKNGDGAEAREVEYEDTEATNAMRDTLTAYNALLSRTFIDIPTLDDPYIERIVTGGPREGQVERVSTLANRTYVRRVFSRGSWELNGRFYGGWWQQVNRKTRSKIFIDDVPTIEVDFKGLHVALLSNEQGHPIEGDPYDLNGFSLAGVPAVLLRKLVKQLVLTAINAKTRASAFAAFRDGWPADHYGKSMTNSQLETLLEAFIRKHPHLDGSLCSDQGIRLMYLDSQIAARLIDTYTAAGIPILSVHDSFIVPYDQTGRLKALMPRAALGVIGHQLEVDCDETGLDETKDWDRDRQLDFIHWRQLPRSPGYLRRLEQHEEKVRESKGG